LNRFLKLVHMELHRLRYILAALMIITLIFQLGSVVSVVSDELAARDADPTYNGVRSLYVPAGMMSFTWVVSTTSYFFIIPMLISAAVIGLYIFIIWYRDWLGRSSFIYRLLMLPTERRHIYLAKLSAILLAVFGLCSYQLLLLPLEKLVFNMMVSSDLRVDSYWSEVMSSNRALNLLFPQTLDQFLFQYGIGILVVLLIFTAIMIERSYRRIGIVYALIYVLASVFAVFYVPVLLGIGDYEAYLYPKELILITLAIYVLVVILSVGLGFRLLAKKVTV